MKEWFDGLEPRERLILSVGAVFLALVLAWVLLIHPLYVASGERAERVAQLRADLARATALGVEIRTLGSAGPTRTAPGAANQSLMILLERSAREAGLQVNQSRPLDTTTVRVRFEAAPFDTLVRWMGTLANRYGVQADVVSLDQLDAPGMVDAQITLKRPTA